MFTKYKVILINDHLLIDDEQRVIIDTGSPTSFHDTGNLSLCGENIDVPTSFINVNSEYLTKEIGGEIHGLIGMDIISKYPILFDLKNGVIFFDDDAQYISSFPTYNLPGKLFYIELYVNGVKVRLAVDTGANTSYLLAHFVEGKLSIGSKRDFSPLLGDFNTNLYECNVQLFHNKSIVMTFGTLPSSVATSLELLNIQGIIGIEFFKKFRLQLRNGTLYFPPQGI